MPGPGCICGFLGREKEYVIPFCDVCQIGSDIILVSFKEKEKEKPEITASSEDTIRLQTERDTYKTMYEQLLNRLVNGGAA